MKLQGKKIGILIESDFYEHEIWYYRYRFPEEGAELHFLSRLWGNSSLTFKGHEYQVTCHNNLYGDAVNMGAVYTDADAMVDGDLVTARTGGHAHLFARQIIGAVCPSPHLESADFLQLGAGAVFPQSRPF